MLLNVKNYMSGWLGKVIVVFVCLALVLLGLQYYFMARGGQSAVLANAGDKKITQKEFRPLFTRYENRLVRKHGPLTQTERQQVARAILNAMITDKVMSQGLRQFGLAVAPDVVKQFIQGLPEFQQAGHFSADKFRRFLQNQQFTAEQFTQDSTVRFISNQLQSGLLASTLSFKSERFKFARWALQKRAFSVAVLHPKQFVHDSKPITDKEVKQYYQAHQSSYHMPAMATVDYIHVSVNDLMQKTNIPAQEMRQYYNDNKQAFRAPSVYQFSIIPSKGLSPDDQKNMTAQLSTDSFQGLMKKYKGRALTQSADKMAPALLQKLNQQAVGVGVQQVAYKGQAVWLYLSAIKPGSILSYSAAKPRVRRLLVQQRLQKVVAAEAERLANLTYMNADSLLPASKALGYPIKTTAAFVQGDVGKGILASSAVRAAAFSADVREGQNSSVIHLAGGSLVVLRLQHYAAPKVKQLSVVRPQIVKVIQANRDKMQMGLLAIQLSKRLSKGESLAGYFAKHGLRWQHISGLTRHLPKYSHQSWLSAAFRLQKLGLSTTLPQLEGSIALVRLDKVTDPTTAEIKSFLKRPGMRGVLIRPYYRMLSAGVQASFQRAVKVKVLAKKLIP